MYQLKCKSEKIESASRRLSCIYPDICTNLNTDHQPLIHLYQRARKLPGIKQIKIASAMYYTGKNPLRKVTCYSEEVSIVTNAKQRRLHKTFLRYHDPNNWPILREGLKKMG